MSDTRGSEWRKWDLQIQPMDPAWLPNPSENHAAIEASTRSLMNELVANDVNTIAITDHNCGYAIDVAQKIVDDDGSDIVILPGVEIETIEGWHCIIIFDPLYKDNIGASSWHDAVIQFTRSYGEIEGALFNEDGSARQVTRATKKLIKAIINDGIGLFIFSHCDTGGKGFFDRGNSTTRKEILENHPGIIFDSKQGSLNQIEQKIRNVLNDQSYKIDYPIISTSDAHSVGELGRFTWIKADRTFEGLKQIIFEPSRTFLDEDNPIEPTNTIDKFTLNIPNGAEITVKQNDGTYKTEAFCFDATSESVALSPYFNTIVGGRGTGKSTILNFFGQHSAETNSSNDFWKKLAPSFDPKDESIFSFEGVRQFEFIGQSEVEDFAMDKEKFTEAIYSRADILGEGGLTASQNKLAPLLDQINEYEGLIIEVSDIEEAIGEIDLGIDTLDKSIKITKSKAYETIVKQITQDSNDLQELASWRESINEYRKSIEDAQIDFDESDDDDDAAAVQDDNGDESAAHLYEQAYEKSQEYIAAALAEIDEEKFIALVEKEEALQTKIEENEEELSGLLEKAGLSEENIIQVKSAPQKLVQLTEKRKKLVKRMDEKNEILKNYGATISAIGSAKHEFEESIKSSISPLNQTLKQQAQENQHKDIKDIELQYYFDELGAWKEIAEEFYEAFQDAYSNGERPDLVKELVVENRAAFNGDLKQIRQLIESKGKGSGVAGYIRFASDVFDSEHNYEIFKAIRDRRLNDVSRYKRVQVLYGGRGIEFASFGQKCTAVVVILMLFGNYPLIIDEPEAHLDGSLIANYLVPLIKNKKLNRQIVFATHNANFVVNGDAEKIIILKNDVHTAFIETTIENTVHREDLLKLEGGKAAFKKRSDKLHIL